MKIFQTSRPLRLAFCVVLLAVAFLRIAYHPAVSDTPLLRVAFLAAWGAWALAVLLAGRSETEPEWRRYDRRAAILAVVVLVFDLAWPNGWSYLKPGYVAISICSPLLVMALCGKPTNRRRFTNV